MPSDENWSVIESDSGTFTQLIMALGATGVQVEDLRTFNDNLYKFDPYCIPHGLIFKHTKTEEPPSPLVINEGLSTIYFAKQVAQNSSPTQVLVQLLLNCSHPDLDLGQKLSLFKYNSMTVDPEERGHVIGNSQTIRSAHNLLVQQNVFEAVTNTEDVDEYQFVGFIPIKGRLYELDGLQDGPIDHGPIEPGQNWLDVARPIIIAKMNAYTQMGIRYQLMTLLSNRKLVYERHLQNIINNLDMLDTENDVTSVVIQYLCMWIGREEEKMANYELELELRRQFYMP